MRRPTSLTVSCTIRLAALSAVVTMPACFNLPHIDPGNRVIADFMGDAGLYPTWSLFGPWTCSAYVDPSPPGDGGQDGGARGGDIDAGQAFNCQPELAPGSADTSVPSNGAQHLVASFNITTADQPVDVDVATAARSRPVNLAPFSQFLFDAKLGSMMPGGASALPPGTEIKVELRCSGTNPYEPLVDRDFTISPEATGWKPITLSLDNFMGPSQRQGCLAAVDGIGFVVVPGSARAGTQITGMLQLDNVELK